MVGQWGPEVSNGKSGPKSPQDAEISASGMGLSIGGPSPSADPSSSYSEAVAYLNVMEMKSSSTNLSKRGGSAVSAVSNQIQKQSGPTQRQPSASRRVDTTVQARDNAPPTTDE